MVTSLLDFGRIPMTVFTMSTPCSCLSSFPLKKTLRSSFFVFWPKFYLISQNPRMFHLYLSISCVSSWSFPAVLSVHVFHAPMVMLFLPWILSPWWNPSAHLALVIERWRYPPSDAVLTPAISPIIGRLMEGGNVLFFPIQVQKDLTTAQCSLQSLLLMCWMCMNHGGKSRSCYSGYPQAIIIFRLYFFFGCYLFSIFSFLSFPSFSLSFFLSFFPLLLYAVWHKKADWSVLI